MPPIFVRVLRFLAFTTAATTLVSSALAGTKFQVLFTCPGGNNAAYPYGQLTLDGAGRVYGAAQGGSTTACNGNGCGTVFQLVPKNSHWSERLLTNFPDAPQPVGPVGPLVIDNAGNIYGAGTDVYYNNGQWVYGQLFQLLNSAGSYTESTLHYFAGGADDAADVNPGLVRDREGNLYGSSFNGGALNNAGTVFEFSPNGDGTWSETLIYQFGDGRTTNPIETMAIDKAGNLYGTTVIGGAYGYGSVYQLSQASGVWTFRELYDFIPTLGFNTAANPGGLVIDDAGNLYGNSENEGFYGVGTLYKLTPTTGTGYWRYSLIHTFTGALDGGYPTGGLALDSSHAIYGTTLAGGSFGYGTVYKFVYGADGRWNEAVLHSFTGGLDGYQADGVILDASGNIYGVAESGGADLYGVVYEVMQ